MNLKRITYAEDPAIKETIFDDVKVHVWPEFMFHDGVAGQLWDILENDFAEYQFVLKDGDHGDAIVALGHMLPFRWEQPLAALPDGGWDAIFEKAVDDLKAGREPNMATAIEASILPQHQGKGLSKVVISTMRDIAKARGFKTLVAPVRPSQKSKYPLTPMDRYVQWTNDKGEPFDAWLRMHWRMGARIVKVAPRSMEIQNTVSKWEAWTTMKFPDGGNYIVPGALVPVQIDRERDCGEYIEPNVWMAHEL